MKNERILPFAMSTIITEEDLGSVSGGSTILTMQATYRPDGSHDDYPDTLHDG